MSERWLIPTWIEPETFTPEGMFHRCDSSEGIVPKTLRQSGGIKRFLGRKAFAACSYLGSYGMGGPGFAGVGFEKTDELPVEWLVLRLWGSGDWMSINGKYETAAHDIWSKFSETLQKNPIALASAKMNRRSCSLEIGRFVISISSNPKDRPVIGNSSRKQPKDKSLLDAFIVCPVHNAEKYPQLIV